MGSSNLTPQTLRQTMDQLGEGIVAATGAVAKPLQNRAGDSKNPFINGHRDSSVHWQLLDDEAVETARADNKLIFLHIGYRACHHCRLMDFESFSNPECIALLNEFFVPILVDREERPDLDTAYMNYVQAVSNVGGWPLNLFLTPSLEPVFGGTYWPGPGNTRRVPSDTGNDVLDFLTVLRKMKESWENQESRCRREATEVINQLREFAAEGVLGTRGISRPQSMSIPANWSASVGLTTTNTERKGSTISTELDLDQLEEAYRRIAGTFDPVYGGFGLAPKFPTPPKLSFLLQLLKFPQAVQDVVGEAECKHAQTIALQTLRHIRDSALRDHVGGTGFFRCSVTPDWSIPNYEKLVVDNALLLSLYVEAWKATGGHADGEFLDVVQELAAYLTSTPISLPQGGFASSEAADSYARRGDTDLVEGAYYLWTSREFDSVTGASNSHISQVAAAYWDVKEDGNVDQDHDTNDNFINQNILRVVKTFEDLSTQFSVPVSTAKEYIQTAKQQLRAAREKDRVHPEIDDKIVTGMNGLVISALSRTALALKTLNPTDSTKYLDVAKKAIAFIKENLWDESNQELYRIWKDGKGTKGFADDYAYLTLGLLDLHEATSDDTYLKFAEQLTNVQKSNFYDRHGAFFTSTASYPHTILRLKDGMDTSLPSTNAVSVSNLFRLGKLLNNEEYLGTAKETINAFEAEMLQYPWLFPGLLGGVVAARIGNGQ